MVNNPWTEEHWNVTAQGAYVRQYGVAVASRTARSAGSAIGAIHPARTEPKIVVKNFILNKTVLVSGSGSNITQGGRGYSGIGVPDENVGS